MTEEACEELKIYFVTTALPGPADECVFVEVEDQNGKGMGPAGSGGDWEKHPVHDGLYRLGPFARYGVRHVETQASFEAELRAKDAEIKILEARNAPALALHREVQEDRDRVLAELEKAEDERDTSIRAIAAMTPVIEKANEVLIAKEEDLKAKQREVAGLRRTIDEERSQAAHERRNLESQVVAARVGR